MLRYDDKFDITSALQSPFSDEYLRPSGRIHYDYNGCLPSDDDAADHYSIYQRVINASL